MGFHKGIVGVISICKVACMITTVPSISSFSYPNTFLHCLCINNPQITFTDEPRWKIINFQFENLWYLIHSSTTKVKGYRCELSYVFSPDQINLIYQKGFNFQMQSGKKPKKYCSKKILSIKLEVVVKTTTGILLFILWKTLFDLIWIWQRTKICIFHLTNVFNS